MKCVAPNSALRFVGSFDLLVTAMLAVPGLSHGFIWLIGSIGTATGLSEPLPELPPFAMLFINLAGILGVCWNLVILQTRLDLAIRINIVARWGVAALIVYNVVLLGVTPILLLFVVSEIVGSLVEIRSRKS